MLILQNGWIVTYMRTYIAFLVVNGVRGSSSSSVDNKDCAELYSIFVQINTNKAGIFEASFFRGTLIWSLFLMSRGTNSISM